MLFSTVIVQNKNSFIATMFAIFMQLENNVSVIDHKFLVPGHTHMECDSDHAVIEKKKNKSSIKIHHPRHWYQFVRAVGVKKKFLVNEMDQSNIFDDNGDKFSWHHIKWFRFTKEYGNIYFKTSLSEEEPFKCIHITKRGINCVKIKDLKICYDSPIKINNKKKNDLIDMLPLVDEIYRDFYMNLTSEDMLDCHPDLTETEENNE